MVASAAGGVLFIDEAYSLAGDQYGQESVDTLVKEMEDRRDDLVLIVAGYPDPMAVFIAQNPGLSSRFRTTIEFADYTDDELVEIFTGMAEAADYDVTEGCLQPVPDDPGHRRRADRCSATAGSPATCSRRPSAGTPGGCATSTEPTLEQLRELAGRGPRRPEPCRRTSRAEPVDQSTGSDARADRPTRAGRRRPRRRPAMSSG